MKWLILLGIGITCLAVTYGVLRDRAYAGVGLPDYSIYSDGRDGYAQAAELLRKLGWKPVAVTRPILQTHHRGLLVFANSTDSLDTFLSGPALSNTDTDNLLEWVSRGNTLLACGRRNTRLHEKLGVVISDTGDSGDIVYQATAGAVGEYTARVNRIALERAATVAGRKAVPLWWLGSWPAAVAVSHGEGRVLIVPDPSVLTHRGLLRDDNATFLYNLAALDAEEGRVYFDEYHHGIRSGAGFWSYLRYHSQDWIVLQLLLVGGMVWWTFGRRLGPAQPMPIIKRADGVDYASSVARIYEKADARPLVAGSVARHFVAAVTARLRLRRGTAPAEILKTWRKRHGEKSASVLARLLPAAIELRKSPPPKSDPLLVLAREFDGFLKNELR
jgi:hypothetical protein